MEICLYLTYQPNCRIKWIKEKKKKHRVINSCKSKITKIKMFFEFIAYFIITTLEQKMNVYCLLTHYLANLRSFLVQMKKIELRFELIKVTSFLYNT